ncbi:MAG TPA: class I SAM-dependent methyltransferase, partial [Chthoniobacterales bacterium]
PRYPRELFEYLASVAPNRDLAWDCATGNGQAAVFLGDHFERVIATDASEKQIANATPHEHVEYRVATAEASGLEPESVALVSVAQALHWFNRAKFFSETDRVLQPDGILAVSVYNFFKIAPGIDQAVSRFYSEVVGPYWDFERRDVENSYRGIVFPFEDVKAPEFKMTVSWSLEHALAYVRTWSATKAFITRRGFDPVDSLGQELEPIWSSPLKVEWPLRVIVRRKRQRPDRSLA